MHAINGILFNHESPRRGETFVTRRIARAAAGGRCFAHGGLDWTRHVRFDERRLRPVEVPTPVGDPSRAARELGWRPRTFVPELARIMVDAELSTLGGPVSGLTSLAG